MIATLPLIVLPTLATALIYSYYTTTEDPMDDFNPDGTNTLIVDKSSDLYQTGARSPRTPEDLDDIVQSVLDNYNSDFIYTFNYPVESDSSMNNNIINWDSYTPKIMSTIISYQESTIPLDSKKAEQHITLIVKGSEDLINDEHFNLLLKCGKSYGINLIFITNTAPTQYKSFDNLVLFRDNETRIIDNY
jgi:hypothetical protein